MKTIAALFLTILIMLGGLYAAVAQTPKPPQPIFVVGQQYGVIYSCIAQVGCYGELITVQAIRPDGWLVVDAAPDPNRWFLNPDAIVSVTPIVQQRAAR